MKMTREQLKELEQEGAQVTRRKPATPKKKAASKPPQPKVKSEEPGMAAMRATVKYLDEQAKIQRDTGERQARVIEDFTEQMKALVARIERPSTVVFDIERDKNDRMNRVVATLGAAE